MLSLFCLFQNHNLLTKVQRYFLLRFLSVMHSQLLPWSSQATQPGLQMSLYYSSPTFPMRHATRGFLDHALSHWSYLKDFFLQCCLFRKCLVKQLTYHCFCFCYLLDFRKPHCKVKLFMFSSWHDHTHHFSICTFEFFFSVFNIYSFLKSHFKFNSILALKDLN